MSIKSKIKIHLWNLPRWFASPFFAISILLGCLIAGGITFNAWIAVIAGLLIMAGGHSANSLIDYAWTGLDKGEKEDRSAEKSYTGGQNLIENGLVSLKGITINVIVWYVLALIPLIWLSIHADARILWLGLVGMMGTVAYGYSKFNWLHETTLGVLVGPICGLLGAFAVNPNPPIVSVILVSIIPAVVLSFAGLALDEFPDAAANLRKGVKSIAYKIWEYSEITTTMDRLQLPDWAPGDLWYKSCSLLQWYLTTWLLMLFGFQIFLISVHILKPMTGLGFLMFPPILCSLVFLRKHFNRTAVVIIALAAVYLALILVGQIVG